MKGEWPADCWQVPETARNLNRRPVNLERESAKRPASPPEAQSEYVARKINRETIVLLGWGRAILLQLAHPLVAAAVADYSQFRQHPDGYLRRARRTVGAMLAMTFGTEEQASAVAARINAIHAQINGTLRQPAGIFPAGTPYSARDPRAALLGARDAARLDDPRVSAFRGAVVARGKGSILRRGRSVCAAARDSTVARACNRARARLLRSEHARQRPDRCDRNRQDAVAGIAVAAPWSGGAVVPDRPPDNHGAAPSCHS